MIKLNDYPVIQSRATGPETHKVMVLRGNHPVHPYVVAMWHPDLGTSWVNGHYFKTKEEAQQEFDR